MGYYKISSETLASIPNKAFFGLANVKAIKIQDSIESIGESAFEQCINLTSVTLPNGCQSIGTRAFAECTSLTQIIIPTQTHSIPDSMCEGCASLENIQFGICRSIGVAAFKRCVSLKMITLPNHTKKIGADCFNGCELLECVSYNGTRYTTDEQLLAALAKANVTVGDGAFANTPLAEKVYDYSCMTYQTTDDNPADISTNIWPQDVSNFIDTDTVLDDSSDENAHDNRFCNYPALFQFNALQAPVLYAACETINNFCSITTDSKAFRFSNGSDTSQVDFNAIQQSYYLGLNGILIIGLPNLPETGYDQPDVVCFDGICPNCYNEYNVQKHITLLSDGYCKCPTCGRIYDLNNLGDVSVGNSGRNLYRYRVSYVNNYVNVCN